VSIEGLGGLQLYRPTGRQRSQKATCLGWLAPLGRRCGDGTHHARWLQ